MSDRSGIEWTDATWNPVRGCTRVSPGCGGPNHQGGCYAEQIAARFSDPGQAYHGFAERTAHGGRWTGKVALVESQLTLPLRWRKPRRIFVNSMSDLFHEGLPQFEIAQVFAVMAVAQQHIFQVLTKRADRMVALLREESFWDEVDAFAHELAFDHSDPHARRTDDYRAIAAEADADEPLPNVWLGVSAEDQERADERIPLLLQTPAAVRFVSLEPLLGPIDLTRIWARMPSGGQSLWNVLKGADLDSVPDQPHLDWIIVGGESGPNARPMHPAWAQSLRDQCAAAAVPYFFKQWGEWAASGPHNFDTIIGPTGVVLRPNQMWLDSPTPGARLLVTRVGKKAAGRLLDGREWNEFPGEARP